jgi:3-dehydroquinate synthase
VSDPGPASALPPPAGGTIEQRFTIEFSYPVVFARDIFAPDAEALAWTLRRHEPQRHHRVMMLIDEGVAAAWPDLAARATAWFAARAPTLQLVAAPHVVPGGEAAKNDPGLIAALQARFAAAQLDRHSFVLALGGGAMLDAVGYATATTHRGLRLVRAPTTVLAQNDAGIGVKNGVNAFGAKNFLGTFTPPFAVINDGALLQTLSERDRRAGTAEAIKVALIRDADFYEWLRQHAAQLRDGETAAVDAMIRRCADLHLRHIRTSGDPFELGSARPLDFGHWAAHKLETMSQHALRHGEAVAIGLALDLRLSAAMGLVDAETAVRAVRLIADVGLPTWHEALDRRDDAGAHVVLEGLEEFRQHLGGQLTITLLGALGTGVEVHAVDPALVTACIETLRPPGSS